MQIRITPLLLIPVLACARDSAVLHFHIRPGVFASVLVNANDVDAQIKGRDLVVRLTNVGVAYKGEGTFEVRNVSVTAYRNDGTKIAESESVPLRPPDTNTATIRLPSPVFVHIPGAARDCRSLCAVALTLHYNSPAGEASAQSDRAALDFEKGLTRDAVVPHPPLAANSGPCQFLNEADASAVLGQHLMYRERAGDNCTIAPVVGRPTAGAVPFLDFGVSANVADYDKFIALPDAAVLGGVGDRAMWSAQKHTLAAVKGERLLVLRLVDEKVPPVLTEDELQQKASALAAKILEKM